MQMYKRLPITVEINVQIGTELESPEKIKEMVEDAISFYMEEGFYRDNNGKKIEFTLSTEIVTVYDIDGNDLTAKDETL